MQAKELLVTRRFSRWEPVEAISAELSANNKDSTPLGTVSLGGDQQVTAAQLTNVAVHGYFVSIDANLLSGPGFSGVNSKDHESNVTLAAMEAIPGKGYSAVTGAEVYPRNLCRAGVFARIVSLSLARSGVRAPVLSLLVEILNAGLAPAFSSEAMAGKELCLALFGSESVEMFTTTGAKTPASVALKQAKLEALQTMSRVEADTLVQGQFLCTGGACLFAGAASNIMKASEGISALSVEAIGASTTGFAADQFEQARQHRGQITSSLNMRLMLEGSKRAGSVPIDADASAPFITIPQVHGPAMDAIAASLKAVELELNSSEIGPTKENELGLDPSQMLLATQAISAALHVVSLSSAARTAALLGDDRRPTPVLPASRAAVALSEGISQVQALAALLRQELSQSLSMLAALELAATGGKNKEGKQGDDRNPNKPAQDESNWTPAQRAKAEAARKKKEEKAAAKAAAKGGKSGVVLGAGTGALRSSIGQAYKSSEMLSKQLDPFSTSDDSIAALTSLTIEKLSSGGKRRPKTAKGTRDYGPEQMRIRQEVFSTIRKVFKRHGGVEIDTPVFELKEVLTGKYGEDTKLIYDLADQGGEFLALRYDLTVPFARFLAMNSVGNIKRYHIAKVYRRDQPQLSRGRYREFYQCDFDIAGAYSPMTADAEAITVGCEILTALPVGNICVKLNHRVLLDAIFEIAGVPAEKFRPICSAVDKLDKAPWEEVRREMVEEKGLSLEIAERIGKFVLNTSELGKPRELWQQMTDSSTFGDHAGAAVAMKEMDLLFSYLEAMGTIQHVSFDMSLARGLDYYTGPIYEIVVLEGTTAVGSISAGGRYDNLVGMFSTSGAQTPCVGISIGIERVFTIMEKKAAEKKLLSADITEVYIASIGGNSLTHRMKIAQQLWRADISAEYSHKENPKLKPQMDEVLERGIPFMVVFGEDEVAKGIVKLKNMRERTEDEVPLDDLVSTLESAGCSTVTRSDSSFMDKLRE